jgi:glycosyltransferase involved in cell wall biosynthesis
VMTRQSLNFYQGNAPWSWLAERLLHRQMQAILGVSRRVVEQLRDEEAAPADRVGLIYNGVDAALFSDNSQRAALRRELGLADSTLVMVVVANLIPYKGHSDLFEALKIAQSALGEDWRLLIVGRDDGIGGELRNLARTLSIDKYVQFLGQRRDIAAILSASDVGILSSHQEGFSIAVIEGMASKLPMIVTDVGGNAEAIVDGVSGLIVPPRDPSGLAQAILRVATDADLRMRLGRAACERVQQHFSIEDCVRQHERLYRAMIASSRLPVEKILADAAVESAH